MKSTLRALGFVALATGLTATAFGGNGKQVTATGWFADEKCARARAGSGTFTATNAECARKCVKDGAKVVFIAEAQKAVWLVEPRDEYVAPIGDYIEIAGTLDEVSGEFQIASIKAIGHVKPSCGIPQRKTQDHKDPDASRH